MTTTDPDLTRRRAWSTVRAAIDQRGPCTQHRRDGQVRGDRIERRREQLGEAAVGADADERFAPAVVEHREPEREIVEQLVGEHDAVERVVRR